MTTEPDMIQQAGQLLRKAQSGEPIATFPETDALQATVDTAIVIASAVLAVAGELRSAQLATAEDLTRIVYALERISHRLDAVTIGPDSVTVREDRRG